MTASIPGQTKFADAGEAVGIFDEATWRPGIFRVPPFCSWSIPFRVLTVFGGGAEAAPSRSLELRLFFETGSSVDRLMGNLQLLLLAVDELAGDTGSE